MGREEGSGADDPFEHVVLDDSFVQKAQQRELSAEERIERARRIAAERHARERLSAQWQERTVRPPARARLFGPGWRPAIVLALVTSLIMWVTLGSLGSKGGLWASGRPLFREVTGGRPTARAAPSATPLLVPTAQVYPDASYAFLANQPGSDRGVTYDPCRPIPVVVNSRTAPPGAGQVLDEAIALMSSIAGLQFVREGPTDEAPTLQRKAFQPDRYGDRWAPVLIAWSDEEEWPLLAGTIAGTGGSAALTLDDQDARVYVTGEIVLDGPQLGERIGDSYGFASARAVILHELGHLIGLDHVDDEDQLMAPSGKQGITSLQPGDITGIAFLRTGTPCVPRL